MNATASVSLVAAPPTSSSSGSSSSSGGKQQQQQQQQQRNVPSVVCGDSGFYVQVNTPSSSAVGSSSSDGMATASSSKRFYFDRCTPPANQAATSTATGRNRKLVIAPSSTPVVAFGSDDVLTSCKHVVSGGTAVMIHGAVAPSVEQHSSSVDRQILLDQIQASRMASVERILSVLSEQLASTSSNPSNATPPRTRDSSGSARSSLNNDGSTESSNQIWFHCAAFTDSQLIELRHERKLDPVADLLQDYNSLYRQCGRSGTEGLNNISELIKMRSPTMPFMLSIRIEYEHTLQQKEDKTTSIAQMGHLLYVDLGAPAWSEACKSLVPIENTNTNSGGSSRSAITRILNALTHTVMLMTGKAILDDTARSIYSGAPVAQLLRHYIGSNSKLSLGLVVPVGMHTVTSGDDSQKQITADADTVAALAFGETVRKIVCNPFSSVSLDRRLVHNFERSEWYRDQYLSTKSENEQLKSVLESSKSKYEQLTIKYNEAIRQSTSNQELLMERIKLLTDQCQQYKEVAEMLQVDGQEQIGQERLKLIETIEDKRKLQVTLHEKDLIINEREREINKMKKRLEEMNSMFSEIEDQNQQYQSLCNEKDNEIDQLNKQCDEGEAYVAGLHSKLELASKKIASTENHLNAARNDVENYTQQLDNVSSQLNEIRTQSVISTSEVKRLTSELNELRQSSGKEVSQLVERNAQLTVLADSKTKEVRKLEESIKQIRASEHDRVIQAIADVKNEFTSSQQKLASSTASTTAEFESLRNSSENEKSKLMARIEKLKEKLKFMADTADSLRDERDQLLLKLQQAEHQAELSKVRAEVTSSMIATVAANTAKSPPVLPLVSQSVSAAASSDAEFDIIPRKRAAKTARAAAVRKRVETSMIDSDDSVGTGNDSGVETNDADSDYHEPEPKASRGRKVTNGAARGTKSNNPTTTAATKRKRGANSNETAETETNILPPPAAPVAQTNPVNNRRKQPAAVTVPPHPPPSSAAATANQPLPSPPLSNGTMPSDSSVNDLPPSQLTRSLSNSATSNRASMLSPLSSPLSQQARLNRASVSGSTSPISTTASITGDSADGQAQSKPKKRKLNMNRTLKALGIPL